MMDLLTSIFIGSEIPDKEWIEAWEKMASIHYSLDKTPFYVGIPIFWYSLKIESQDSWQHVQTNFLNPAL